MKYDAFVSYSHRADDALAPALQSALHAFARPWNRLRALHVFRDQTSLAASPELWPAIVTALNESRYLLLLASPAAAESRWVGREIAWWLANRSAQTLFILVTDGELVWDETAGDFDWAQTTCLPRETLAGQLRSEPLWIDLRWAKAVELLTLRNTRFRQAVLDIAAPLHGQDKDALDGDDVRRFATLQRLRRGAIAGLAGLTVAALAAAWMAVRQRDAAERQTLLAQLGRLSVQADLLRERGGAPDPSVMLAAEGLRRLTALGETSLEADLSLRRALAGLPRAMGELKISADAFQLDPGGGHLVTEGTGGQVSVRTVPEGRGLGCDWSAVAALRGQSDGSAPWLVAAISATGDWCLLRRPERDRSFSLELWSTQPLQRVAQWRASSQAGHLRPAVSADGEWVATTDPVQTGTVTASILRLWSRSRGAEVQRLDAVEFRVFAPDSRHFATTNGLWRLPPGGVGQPQRIIKWESEPVDIVFSASGSRVATRRRVDGQVEIWGTSSAKLMSWPAPPPGTLLALSDSGHEIVVVGRGDRDPGLVTWLWDAEWDVARAQVSLEATTAAFTGRDATLLVTETDGIGGVIQRVLSLPAQGAAWASTGLPEGSEVRWLGITNDRVQMLVSDVAALRLRHWLFAKDAWSDTLTVPANAAWTVSTDGRHFAVAVGGRLLTGPLDGSSAPAVVQLPSAAQRVALSRDGRFVSALIGDHAHLWQPGTDLHQTVALGRRAGALQLSSDGVFGIALLPDGDTSRAGTAALLRRWRWAETSNAVTLAIARQQQPLATACMVSDDGLFVRAAGVRQPFTAQEQALHVSPADLDECQPDAGGPVRVQTQGARVFVSAAAGNSLAQLDHKAEVLKAASSADGRFVATVDDSRALHVFALAPADLIAQTCARQPRPLPASLQPLLPGSVMAVDACGRAAGGVPGR